MYDKVLSFGVENRAIEVGWGLAGTIRFLKFELCTQGSYQRISFFLSKYFYYGKIIL